jgi:hypothetical protein
MEPGLGVIHPKAHADAVFDTRLDNDFSAFCAAERTSATARMSERGSNNHLTCALEESTSMRRDAGSCSVYHTSANRVTSRRI